MERLRKVLFAEMFPNYPRWMFYPQALLFLVASAIMLVGLWMPAPGIAIGALGLAAVVMAARGASSTRAENIVWIVIATLLFFFESKAIYKDREDNEAQQAAVRAEEIRSFKEVSSGIQATIKNSQREFNATISEVGTVLDKTNGVAKLAEESLNNIVGAGSFPYVVPQIQEQTTPIPLFIVDQGKHLLTGVSVVIRNSKDFTQGDAALLNRPAVDVGVLHPGWGKTLKVGISPDPNSAGLDIYEIEMYTQSDSFTEILQFRKAKHTPPLWAYRFWVVKHILKRTLRENVDNPKLMMKDSRWSDELSERTPAK